MAWIAVDRFLLMQSQQGSCLPGYGSRLEDLHEAIHADICARAFDARRGSFMQAYDSPHLDASTLLLPLIGRRLRLAAAMATPAQTRVVVITGAGAGVGRAVAEEFARNGWSVALLSRDAARLELAASQLLERHNVRALGIPTDVASAEAIEAAAERIERELGPIHTWVNVAMTTVFGPVSSLSAAEAERVTQVTYLGQVYGMMSALKRMRLRNDGVIVNVGSALVYRSIPLQSLYCGAKAAIRGFTDSLRSELLHDKLAIRLTMVDLPAINTPQFDWALNKTGRRAQPVPPIFQPEVAARAIYFAATHKRREVWLGFPTVKAILANRLAPGLLDRYLADKGYTGQLTGEEQPADTPSNLFAPVPGPFGAHGRFDARARNSSWTMFTDRHRAIAFATVSLVLAAVALHRIARRRDG